MLSKKNLTKRLFNKQIILCAMIIPILFSCVSSENTLRKVTDGNIFISSSLPDMQIQVTDDLSYLGMASNSRYPLESRNNINMPYVFESYVFANTKESLLIQKAVVITVLKSGKSLPNDLFDHEIFYARKEIQTLGDKEYQNAVFSSDLPGNVLTKEKITDMLNGHSFFFADTYVLNSFARSFGQENRMGLYISYIEDFKLIKEGKTDEETLRMFDDRTKEMFRIL